MAILLTKPLRKPKKAAKPLGRPPKPKAANHSKVKGAQAEREVATLLREWLTPVWETMGESPAQIERNLNQSREGGMDLVGLPWLAVEVKRQEALNMKAWWAQTLKQTHPGQTPCLIWRQSRQPWRFRVRTTLLIGPLRHEAVIDLELEEARLWLCAQVQTRILAARRGEAQAWGLTPSGPGPS